MKIIISVILAASLVTTIYADKPSNAGKGKSEKSQKKKHKNNMNEKEIVSDYYHSLPPGLQKKMKRGGELPLGWAKKVKVGQPLPKEYFELATPISDDLRLRLHLDSHTQLFQISNKILKLEVGTNRFLGEIQF